jgi:hypothetical protein
VTPADIDLTGLLSRSLPVDVGEDGSTDEGCGATLTNMFYMIDI